MRVTTVNLENQSATERWRAWANGSMCRKGKFPLTEGSRRSLRFKLGGQGFSRAFCVWLHLSAGVCAQGCAQGSCSSGPQLVAHLLTFAFNSSKKFSTRSERRSDARSPRQTSSLDQIPPRTRPRRLVLVGGIHYDHPEARLDWSRSMI